MSTFDLLIKGARVVDAKNHRDEITDVGIKGGKIAAVAPNLAPSEASEVMQAQGLLLLPGLIDSHVHLGISACGFKMVAAAGVTTCLDMSGTSDDLARIAKTNGAAINYGTLEAILPGKNVPTNDPSTEEIAAFVNKALANGSYGVKILGGHFPLTPKANERLVRYCQENGVYIAWHAGSTETGSDLSGVKEAVAAANGGFLHLPHINAYCRGCPEKAAALSIVVLQILEANPNIVTESYLSSRNGSNLVCDENGIPKSAVPRKCLANFGFSPDKKGLVDAILSGRLAVMKDGQDQTILISGKEGADYFLDQNTNVSGSFSGLNPLSSRVLCATAKRGTSQAFTVDALSTDGGCIPRNVTLKAGLELVDLDGLTMLEFVKKACLMPARILNLPAKGHLSVGADADICVADPIAKTPVRVLAGGNTVFENGKIFNGVPTAFTTSKGLSFYSSQGIPVREANPSFEPLNRLN